MTEYRVKGGYAFQQTVVVKKATPQPAGTIMDLDAEAIKGQEHKLERVRPVRVKCPQCKTETDTIIVDLATMRCPTCHDTGLVIVEAASVPPPAEEPEVEVVAEDTDDSDNKRPSTEPEHKRRTSRRKTTKTKKS